MSKWVCHQWHILLDSKLQDGEDLYFYRIDEMQNIDNEVIVHVKCEYSF